MLNSVKGLWLTLMSTVNGLRDPVTRQYPSTGKAWMRSARPNTGAASLHGISRLDLGCRGRGALLHQLHGFASASALPIACRPP